MPRGRTVGKGDVLTRDELSNLTGATIHVIRELVEQGILLPITGGGSPGLHCTFTQKHVSRLKAYLKRRKNLRDQLEAMKQEVIEG